VQPIEISDAREEDIAAVAHLSRALAAKPVERGEASERAAAERDARDVRTEQQMRQELARPWARLRVARDESGACVGFLLAWMVADEVHVLDVAVRAALRRRGIGGALLRDLLAFARAKGARRVFLEVRVSNAPAIALNRGAGFEDLNTRKSYYSDGEDALEMVLALGSAAP
jgi:ribosomal-protein-alanine N-acetyltransferase